MIVFFHFFAKTCLNIKFFSYICNCNPKRKARHNLLYSLTITTTRKEQIPIIGAAPNGRRFLPYIGMVCGEP